MTTRLRVVPSFVWTYILLTSFLMRMIDLIGLTYLVAHCCLFLAIGPFLCYFPSMYCVRFGLMIKVPSSPPPIIRVRSGCALVNQVRQGLAVPFTWSIFQ